MEKNFIAVRESGGLINPDWMRKLKFESVWFWSKSMILKLHIEREFE